MLQNSLYSIIIPVYNTADSLIIISERIENVFANLPNKSFEILFIDDCSTNPKSWETLSKLQSQNNKIKCIKFMRNFGQQAATICGMRHAKGDFIITMDDDLQHSPEEITELMKWEVHDAVIAQFSDKQHTFSKKLFSKIKYFFDRIIIGNPQNIKLSSFRLINKATKDAILSQANTPYPFISAMLFYATKDVKGANLIHSARTEGQTGYTFYKMIKLFSNLLLNNSSILLRLVGNFGIFISIVSFSLSMYFLFKKLIWGIKIAGWTSLIISILFIGGLILFSLGLIGEYLIRIIKSTENKPLYFIKVTKGIDD
jgi:dolichol-phosphate mannosyltransferase/undecaprenyl-phosphate 4-deoxy-4-formamido-L-arabinose transferase